MFEASATLDSHPLISVSVAIVHKNFSGKLLTSQIEASFNNGTKSLDFVVPPEMVFIFCQSFIMF